jgi:hypothetical protein
MNFNAVFVLTVLLRNILLFIHTAGMQQLKIALFNLLAPEFYI